MAKYLLLFRGGESVSDDENIREWDEYIGKLARDGKIISGLPFGPRAKLVIGPEKQIADLNKAQSSINAYIILDAENIEQVLEYAKLAPNIGRGGTVEVRSTIPPVQ